MEPFHLSAIICAYKLKDGLHRLRHYVRCPSWPYTYRGSHTYFILIVWFNDIFAVEESIDDTNEAAHDKPEIKLCAWKKGRALLTAKSLLLYRPLCPCQWVCSTYCCCTLKNYQLPLCWIS